MILNVTEIIDLVQTKTGRTVNQNSITKICGGASSVEDASLEEPDINMLYACKVEHFSATAGQVVFELNTGAASTELSINAIGEEKGYRSYDLVLFNKINGDISDDTEIHFTGYKFNLI